MAKAVLLDLDGTLLDTAPDLIEGPHGTPAIGPTTKEEEK